MPASTYPPAVEAAREALRETIARYEYVTARDVERPLFWHVDGMRQVRALLAALNAAAADAGVDDGD